MCNQAIETLKKGDFVAEIHYDQSPPNPRVEHDNFGHIVAWHRNYTLSDPDQKYETRGDWLRDILGYNAARQAPDHLIKDCLPERAQDPPSEGDLEWARYCLMDNLDHEDDAQVWALDHLYKTHLVLSLYMYEHGGVALKCSPFSRPWDSGQVGYMYASHEEIVKEYGSLDIERAKKLLIGEVEEFSMYVNGECYYYVIKDGQGIVLDSCGGYLGFDNVLEATQEALDYAFEAAQEATDAVKEYGYA
jgi:hypothetical protein